jgi:tetratricopeptide (TPR) repeat protein
MLWGLGAAGWAVAGVAVWGAEPAPTAEMARTVYQEVRKQSEQADADPAWAWRLGRACFDWAEFATNDMQRAELAREGIRACEQALATDPDLVAAQYYLGMNLGQLARTMNLGALKLVQQMEGHFLKARELDSRFDEAGPDRNLGLLYLEAPGWPVSVGNRSKARNHLTHAVKLAPLYPENRLNLIEAHARWNERRAAKKELDAWQTHLEAARRAFSGERWQGDWIRWEQRLETLKQRIREVKSDRYPPKSGH